MDVNEQNKKFCRMLTCVLFPGLVKNEERALQCLGGIKGISQICAVSNKKRLGMSFQPENPYMKRIYADVRDTAGVLLKVKVKKVKDGDKVKKEVVSTCVLGKVKRIFNFESMCDFQYLPVENDGNGKMRCLLENIIPSGIDTQDFLMNPCPQFLVPSIFTRFDKPTNYSYTCKKYLTDKNKSSEEDDEDLHFRTRLDRARPNVRLTFNLIDEIPTKPHEFHLELFKEKIKVCPQIKQEYETIKKHFEDRPIWTLNLLRFYTKIKLASLKFIMPCLGIYFNSGPWRKTWVRFGYDPRKDPQARIYQTLDFRLRSTAGLHSVVRPRDQFYLYKKPDRVKHLKKKAREEPVSSEDVPEGAVIYRPGMVPSQRQIFYQFCDMKLPEVEALIATEPPGGYLCHQKRGWLPPNADETCRDHIYKYVKESLIATHNAVDLKFEQESSDEGSDSDDDDCASTSAMDVDESLNT